jgi:YD repeat-containing protein
LDTIGPLHRITLEHAVPASGSLPALPAGTDVSARAHVTESYDQGRPASAPIQDLVTEVHFGGLIEGYATEADTRVTTTEYDWTHGLPTKIVEDPGGLKISRTSTYDTRGRLIDSTMPKSSGKDAGATHTSYYTAGGSAPCGGRPEWADLVCQVTPKGAITGGGANPAELITKTFTYTYLGEIDVLSEIANGVTRTTTSSYDDAGRIRTVTVAGGLGTPVPVTTTTYDSRTGRVVKSSADGATVVRDFDMLGRLLTYTDADGGVTNSEYDDLNRLTKIVDSAPSWTTYTYDTAADPRGVLTGIEDAAAGRFTGK